MQKEYKTIEAMISLFCRGRHQTGRGELCDSCGKLLTYAKSRLDKCPFADDKPTCAKCSVHCYKPEQRKQIAQVMRYAGPRMIRSHPLLALRHLLRKLKTPKTVKS
jgi:hypothetical protein